MVGPVILDRSRQGSAIPDSLKRRRIIIAGCGTTGSWTAHNLLRMGIQTVIVIDNDIVEPANLPAQFFPVSAVNEGKPSAFNGAMAALGLPVASAFSMSAEEISLFREDDEPLLDPTDAVIFCCVDSIESRRKLAQICENKAYRFIDYRMGGETGSVIYCGMAVEEPPIKPLSHPSPMSWEAYYRSLDVTFTEQQGCGTKALLSNAHAIVGIGLTHLFKAERGEIRLKGRINIDTAAARIEEAYWWEEAAHFTTGG